MDCVYHHQIGGKVILGIFSNLHFFSGRERNDVVVCLACGSGTISGRLSQACCLACSSGTFSGRLSEACCLACSVRSSGFFSSCTFFPGGKGIRGERLITVDCVYHLTMPGLKLSLTISCHPSTKSLY